MKESSSEFGPIRSRVIAIHKRLSEIHEGQRAVACREGFFCEEYAKLGIEAVELDRELSRIMWEALGLSQRTGTDVPFTQLNLPSNL